MSSFSSLKAKDVIDLIRAIELEVNKNMDTSIPAIVTNVISSNRVEVRPLIKMEFENNNFLSKATITDVPLLSLGNKKTYISFPVQVGDVGWIIACDKDISEFKLKIDESKAPTYRKHSFTDCYFVPDQLCAFERPGKDKDSMFILTDSETSNIKINKDELLLSNNKYSVSVKSDSVTIKNDNGSCLLGDNNLSMIFKGNNITIDDQGVNINGTSFTKDGVVKCKSISSDSIKVGGVEVAKHSHGGVATGTAKTSPLGS